MKHYLFTLLSLAALSVQAQDNPRITTMDLTASELAHYMAPGWNLGNTLEAGSNANCFTNNAGLAAETAWQGTKTTQEIINLVKAQGFKSVRLPAGWVMGHLTDKATMSIDPVWMARVKEVVDYCINANLYVVLNDHWDGGWLEYDGFTTGANVTEKKEQLRLLWTNIANEFKDYDQRLIFAGLNEPGVGGASPNASGSLMFNQYGSNSASVWQAFVDRLQDYEQTFIDAVRATGGNNAQRVLVVQGPKTEISETVTYFDPTKLTDSADKRLMVEIHHYAPYNFCGMESDQSYDNVHVYLTGYTPKRYSTSSKRHVETSTMTSIENSFKSLKTNFVDKGYPVIVGEYGANHKQTPYGSITFTQASHDESIQQWYSLSTQYAYNAGCVPFAWDTNNTGWPRMTVFNRNTVKVADNYIYNGIMAGDKAARTAYETIYPEPSTTGIQAVGQVTVGTTAAVYDVQGRRVATASSEQAVNSLGLERGVYIVNGKKVAL